MSDLNDLIHRNAQLAYEQGKKEERQRVLRLIDHFEEGNGNPYNEKMIVNEETR